MPDLSFQLYSARNFQPFADVFALLSRAGYTEVEGFGWIYEGMSDSELARLKADLDTHGLTMPTGHFSLDILEANPGRAIEIATALGFQSAYCPWLLPEQRPTSSKAWFDFGARLQKAGAPLKKAGFDFGWHNHDFEFFPLEDGSCAQTQIFAGGPDLSWQADIAWIVRGGADPFEWIDRLGQRITSVHVKDIAPTGENADEDGWADVGHGIVPWARLMTALRATPVRHYIVEHDNPGDFERFATRSFASFQSY
nr:sugar phosphate isomerase/epimerase [uncultured Gellertiella sp.]